jgi:hypothetical protein
MPKNKNSPVRLNIYIHDPGMRRQIKAMAAQKDVSVSEFCVQAITNHLLKEKESAGEEIRSPLKLAVKKAYQFQKKTFGGRAFAVSSADLIRESREDRRAL